MSDESTAASQGKMIVFGAKEIRRVFRDGEWFFSVVDIVAALTDSTNARDYWYRLKQREKASSGTELSTLCRQLKLASTDGKAYLTDCVNVRAANEGGSVAGNARKQLEERSGRKVSTRENYLADKPRSKRLPPPE